MFQEFASHIEVRFHRHLGILFTMGAFLWTLLAFFFGFFLGKPQNHPSNPSNQSIHSLFSGEDQEEDWSKSKKKSLVDSSKTKPEKSVEITPKKETKKLLDLRLQLAKKSLKQNKLLLEKQKTVAQKQPTPPAKPKPSQEDSSGLEKKKNELVNKANSHAPSAKFSILVRSRKDLQPVLVLMKEMKKQGYKPLLVMKKTPGQKKQYTLMIGKFSVRSQAEDFLNEFKKIEKKWGKVISLD